MNSTTNSTPGTAVDSSGFTVTRLPQKEFNGSDPILQLGLDAESIPLWILCEITSGFLTLMSLYFLYALARHTYKQTTSRLARRQRDSIVFASKAHPALNDIQKQGDMPTELQKGFCVPDNDNPPSRVPYNEQMSVESTGFSSMGNSHQARVFAINKTKTKERNQGKWLLRFIVLCVFFVLIRCIIEQFLIVVGHSSDALCDGLTKTMIAFTALCLHCCHVFLWLRQLTFYSNPFLKPLRSRKLKILSYAAYAIMPMTLSIALGLYMWWRNYETARGSCKASEHQNLHSYIPFGVLVFCTVTIQILLSALFLYPLIVHKLRRRNMERDLDSDKKSEAGGKQKAPDSPCMRVESKSARNTDKLMQCIKRVLYGATVGITTDVVGAMVGMFLPDDIPMFAYSVLYNLNVSLNVLCLIYTFANWREMLFPWCCQTQAELDFRASKRRNRSSVKHNFRQRAYSRRASLKPKTGKAKLRYIIEISKR